MSGLPLGWADVPLGSLLNFKYGKALPDKERSGKGFPVYGSNGVVGWHSHALTTGTTIVIGRKGSVGALQFSNTPCSPIDTTYYIDEAPGHQFRFWFYRLKSLDLASLNKSTAIPGLSRGDAYQILVALPPLAEQKRIADKLDTVLTRVDAVNTRLARVAPLLKRFRQSVLAAATSGRLTEDWRAVNQINSDWLGKPALALKDYAKLDMGFAFKSADFLNEGLRLLRGDNIEPGGLRWRDAKHIDEDAVRDLGHLMLKVGDLVLAMDRPIISTGLKLARVNEQDVPCVLVQRVCKFNCTPSLSKDFLFLVLQGTAFINHLGAVQNGSGVPHISGAQILSFKLQLPSADEQTEIVRRVETLFAFADRLEARLAQAQTAATRLTPALLAKAFRGELVPQDPNDEPAAELLRRLQAQRAAAPKASAGRGRKAVVQSEG